MISIVDAPCQAPSRRGSSWSLHRQLGWTWADNPAYTTGAGAKGRWRLERAVLEAETALALAFAELVQRGVREPDAVRHLLNGLSTPRQDFGRPLGRNQRGLYLPEVDQSEAARFVRYSGAIYRRLRLFLGSLRMSLRTPTTEKTRRDREQPRSHDPRAQVEQLRAWAEREHVPWEPRPG